MPAQHRAATRSATGHPVATRTSCSGAECGTRFPFVHLITSSEGSLLRSVRPCTLARRSNAAAPAMFTENLTVSTLL